MSLLVLAALDKNSSEDDKPEGEDNAQTIRPNKSPGPNTVPLAKPPSPELNPIVEDYSDLASEEDEQWLQDKVADFKVYLVYLFLYIYSHDTTPDEKTPYDVGFSIQTTSKS